MADLAEYFEDLHLPDEKCADSKLNGWGDEFSSSNSSVISEDMTSSPQRRIGSNSSIVSDDMTGSPQRRIVNSSYLTAYFLNANAHGHNGHKKLNRSQSEPRGRYNKRGNMGELSRYKTELCHPFAENGECKYGEKCQFAHGSHELRVLARHPKYKTELCRTFHAEGYCPYGTRCHFIHEERNLGKTKPSALCLYPGVLSASSVKDLSLSPSSLSSLSPASSTNAFTFAAPVYSPPPSPIEARLPIFKEISPPAMVPFMRQFGGLTA